MAADGDAARAPLTGILVRGLGDGVTEAAVRDVLGDFAADASSIDLGPAKYGMAVVNFPTEDAARATLELHGTVLEETEERKRRLGVLLIKTFVPEGVMFVGLPPSLSKEEVEEIAGRAGPLVKVVLKRKIRLAEVTYESEAGAAAALAMNGTPVGEDGSLVVEPMFISVRKRRGRGRGRGGGGGGGGGEDAPSTPTETSEVSIAGLPDTVTEAEVRAALNADAVIETVRVSVRPDSVMVFVVFDSLEAAAGVVGDLQVGATKGVVDLFFRRGRRGRRRNRRRGDGEGGEEREQRAPQPPTQLRLDGLSADVDEAAVRGAVPGDLLRVKVFHTREPGHAFVKFATHEEAAAALDAGVSIGGAAVEVSFDERRRARRGRGGEPTE